MKKKKENLTYIKKKLIWIFDWYVKVNNFLQQAIINTYLSQKISPLSLIVGIACCGFNCIEMWKKLKHNNKEFIFVFKKLQILKKMKINIYFTLLFIICIINYYFYYLLIILLFIIFMILFFTIYFLLTQ